MCSETEESLCDFAVIVVLCDFVICMLSVREQYYEIVSCDPSGFYSFYFNL